ncbi:MAG: toxin co-regulated pilus biosynthesis Q family protein [Alphaproteobacteria bacterium]|nr:toxin co-regulated pilus biosynthesis Q family protein [Alphaproteobacteria bacterium]
MFRKILIFAMFATAAGYCFAAEYLPQVVTSEVFYDQDKYTEPTGYYDQLNGMQLSTSETFAAPLQVPAWPLAGTDADVEIMCVGGACADRSRDNIRIVSKIGADLVVENNFSLGTAGNFEGWSGGANLLHGNQIPVGFDDECAGTEMSLLHREVLEDDGGNVLSVSRSGRKNCGKYGDGYEAFSVRSGMKVNGKKQNTKVVGGDAIVADTVVKSGQKQATVGRGKRTGKAGRGSVTEEPVWEDANRFVTRESSNSNLAAGADANGEGYVAERSQEYATIDSDTGELVWEEAGGTDMYQDYIATETGVVEPAREDAVYTETYSDYVAGNSVADDGAWEDTGYVETYDEYATGEPVADDGAWEDTGYVETYDEYATGEPIADDGAWEDTGYVETYDEYATGEPIADDGTWEDTGYVDEYAMEDSGEDEYLWEDTAYVDDGDSLDDVLFIDREVDNSGDYAVRDRMEVEDLWDGAPLDEQDYDVEMYADAEASARLADQVRSWVVASGQTLREVLQSWCDKEGWDLVWTTAREYPIEASAVFKGRFVDVASALVRNFGRATPVPYAKFYKGNRVLVISTADE